MVERIDAHQHFWRYSTETHGWIDDSMSVLQRDFLPGDLKPLLAAEGFAGSIAVQAQTTVAETEWLLSLTEKHEFISGVVGWVDLASSNVERDLESLSAHLKLVGIRHIVQSEPEGFMGRADFRRGIAALEAFGLAYDVLIYERQLVEAAELVRAFPRQRFVVDHVAKPDIRNRSFESWQRGMRTLASCDNVWCKISGLVTEADWAGWSAEDFTQYIEAALDAFGPQRCMFGSDWPVCTLAASYADVATIVRDHIVRLSAHEQDAILGGTASAFYGIR